MKSCKFNTNNLELYSCLLRIFKLINNSKADGGLLDIEEVA